MLPRLRVRGPLTGRPGVAAATLPRLPPPARLQGCRPQLNRIRSRRRGDHGGAVPSGVNAATPQTPNPAPAPSSTTPPLETRPHPHPTSSPTPCCT
eukprot:365432-Chlamydomonas_euryale.AAC.1